MEKTITNSSQVTHIKWVDKILTVTFVGDKKYEYLEVPQSIYDAAIAAESIGKFLNNEVKNKFNFNKV